MDQRKEAVFRYIDEHRQEILEDWKALVNHEGSLRQPDAMHAEAEYLCGRFREAGVDCAVYSVSPEIPPVVAGEIGTGRPGKPVIFAGHFDTVFNPWHLRGKSLPHRRGQGLWPRCPGHERRHHHRPVDHQGTGSSRL